MAFETVKIAQEGAGWGTIAALANADGSATHRLLQTLVLGRTPTRLIADSVHLIGMLQGRQPGIIDYAATRCIQPAAVAWLEEAAAAFAIERGYLTRLTSTAGPMPSTPGQADTEATVAAQRHALDMLAQSDRNGCAIGAAVALIIDWMAIRVVLDSASERFGLTIPKCALPDLQETTSMVGAIANAPGIERAMAFGAQQIFAQHRGLWDLIEARASARGDI